MADGSAEEDEKRERKMEPRKRSSSQNTKKIKRKIASSGRMESTEDEKVKTELESASAATAATTCKKSDGKGWHCKRAALRPYSLCEYHLTQVRSYYSSGGSTPHALALPQHQHQQPSRKTHGGGIDANQNAALIPDKKKNSIKKTTSTTTKKKDTGSDRSDVGGDGAGGRAGRKPASDFYYYYSGFGPWRGKRRSGGVDGDRGAQVAGNVDDASDGDDDREVGRDGAPSSKAHDQAPDDLDDDEEDMDGRDEVRRYEGDDVAVGRRRGRKPIKARSLKSLL